MALNTQSAAAPLAPTYKGFIATTMDALVLFEACLSGVISHVPRRPHDRERGSLIASGNVFIYEEHSSGIKRWTDGVPWSPSRILGNFLIYRELDKPFTPGEKKRAMRRTKDSGISKPSTAGRSSSVGYGCAVAAGHSLASYDNQTTTRGEAERALVGSLVDSYSFRPDGLIKKTISVNYRGMQHHMVSYYNLEDVLENRLMTPQQDPHLASITPRSGLISAANFRAPIDDNDLFMSDENVTRARFMATGQVMSGMDFGITGAVSRSMSLPSLTPYPGTQSWGAPPGHQYSMYNGLPPVTPFGSTGSQYGSYEQSSGLQQQSPYASAPYESQSSNLSWQQASSRRLVPSNNQHGGLYDPNTSRHSSGYDNSTSGEQTPAYETTGAQAFDSVPAHANYDDHGPGPWSGPEVPSIFDSYTRQHQQSVSPRLMKVETSHN